MRFEDLQTIRVNFFCNKTHTKMKLVIGFLMSLAVANAATKKTFSPQASGSTHQAEVAILRQSSNIDPEGSYQFAYELENGIKAEESGALVANGKETDVVAQGAYSWISPEGEQVQITYTADANGYQPQGSHIPVPPPVPEAILKALAWAEAHPAPEEKTASLSLSNKKRY